MTLPNDSEAAEVAPPATPRGTFAKDVLPALVWTGLVFVLGGIPTGPSVDIEFPIDKVQHAVAFAILQVLALRALRYELPSAWPRAMPWIAGITSTIIGAALELYQLTVPNRSAELMDLVWDAAGAGLAALLTARFRIARPR